MTDPTSVPDSAFTILARVIGQEGHCAAGHRVGDELFLDSTSVQGKVCIDALCAFLPWVLAMRYGARFPWQEDKEAVVCACPDPANPVVFELRRVRP